MPAANYQNFLEEKWVPVLGLLCDGSLLRFYLYDSAAKEDEPVLFCSRAIEGLPRSDGVSMSDQVEAILRGRFH